MNAGTLVRYLIVGSIICSDWNVSASHTGSGSGSGGGGVGVGPPPTPDECDWSYEDTTNWASICPGSSCDSTSQSPINIGFGNLAIQSSSKLKFSDDYFDRMYGYYHMTDYSLQYTIKNWEDKGPTLTYGDTTYRLEKFMCRWGKDDSYGSEHSLDGKKYALEVQFQHGKYSTRYYTA